MMFKWNRTLNLTLAVSLFLNGSLGSAVAPVATPIRCRDVFAFSQSVDSLLWGLKFLQKPAQVKALAQETTIGIELEGSFSEKFRRYDLAQAAARVLSNKRGYRNIQVNKPDHLLDSRITVSYEDQGQVYEYEFTHDISISPIKNHRGIEIKSPILRKGEDFETYVEVIEALKERFQLTAEPYSAGVHIHVGFPKARAQEIAALVQLFSSIEYEANDYFQKTREREDYTGPTEMAMIDFLETAVVRKIQLPDLMDAQTSRHRGLNIHALDAHGTVEFRLFNSTVNLKQIEFYRNFARGLVEAVRSRDPRLMSFLESQQNAENLDFARLAQALELNIGRTEDFKVHADALNSLVRQPFTIDRYDREPDEHEYFAMGATPPTPSRRRAVVVTVAKSILYASILSLLFSDTAKEFFNSGSQE